MSEEQDSRVIYKKFSCLLAGDGRMHGPFAPVCVVMLLTACLYRAAQIKPGKNHIKWAESCHHPHPQGWSSAWENAGLALQQHWRSGGTEAAGVFLVPGSVSAAAPSWATCCTPHLPTCVDTVLASSVGQHRCVLWKQAAISQPRPGCIVGWNSCW